MRYGRRIAVWSGPLRTAIRLDQSRDREWPGGWAGGNPRNQKNPAPDSATEA